MFDFGYFRGDFLECDLLARVVVCLSMGHFSREAFFVAVMLVKTGVDRESPLWGLSTGVAAFLLLQHKEQSQH